MKSARLRIDRCAWLTDDELLVIGKLPANAPHDGYLELPAGLLGVIPAQPSADIRARSCSVKELAREHLAGLDPELRAAALALVIQATTRTARTEPDRDLRLSQNLHALREALRERLPVGLSEGAPMALVDGIARLDRDAYFLRGRVAAGASELARLTAVSPEGSRVEILDRAYWYELPGVPPTADGAGHWRGFAVCLTCAPSYRSGGWVLELETRAGALLEVAAPPAATTAAEVIREVLEDIGQERLPETRFRRTQVLPALRRYQRGRLRRVEIDSVLELGEQPNSPDVSLVVPLYRRIDLVEHQLLHFAGDAELMAAEIIYVLDSPELEDQLRDTARRLFQLYKQPLRVAMMSDNGGFATANNQGAASARGRLLLLLNSDVFPESHGWLGRLVRFHDGLANPGAVGPKLLYEDDTLQHAGMFFERPPGTHLWNNEHYFKGLHRDLPAAATSRPVPAVTGACMLIARDLYRKLGGLSGDYVQGDFEDSDLCLRLLEAGFENWYCADVALYHLEASSYEGARRQLHDGYNRWIHTHRWGKQIERLTARPVVLEERGSSPLVGEVAG